MERKRLRYSDEELAFFKDLILKKKKMTETMLEEFQSELKGTSSNGTEDTMRTFDPEDGASAEVKTYLASQIYRCNKSLEELNDALLRIENKTYGVSIKTGELIPQERLKCSLTAMFGGYKRQRLLAIVSFFFISKKTED